MALFFTSFGYKYGIPHDTDMIFDVRFLPNPYFVNELRAKTGLDLEVREYVLRNQETRDFLDRLYALARVYLAALRARGKEQSHPGARLHRRTASFRCAG